MTERNEEQPGALIQAYLPARWGDTPDDGAAIGPGARLDDGLRDRVDQLGVDGERLLQVSAAQVLAELERLEREAARGGADS
nr:hypothetical protein [Gammaproteobacteria bacterium]